MTKTTSGNLNERLTALVDSYHDDANWRPAIPRYSQFVAEAFLRKARPDFINLYRDTAEAEASP